MTPEEIDVLDHDELLYAVGDEVARLVDGLRWLRSTAARDYLDGLVTNDEWLSTVANAMPPNWTTVITEHKPSGSWSCQASAIIGGEIVIVRGVGPTEVVARARCVLKVRAEGENA